MAIIIVWVSLTGVKYFSLLFFAVPCLCVAGSNPCERLLLLRTLMLFGALDSSYLCPSLCRCRVVVLVVLLLLLAATDFLLLLPLKLNGILDGQGRIFTLHSKRNLPAFQHRSF